MTNTVPLESKAISILENYNGSNNFLLELKFKLTHNKKFYPTRAQAEYIINYNDITPKVARKWVDLDTYFSDKIAKDKGLIETPTKMWVEKLLVEKDKSYHIWGKFFDNEELGGIWVPKSAIIKSTNKPVDVDYSKYTNRPPLEHQKEAITHLLSNNKFILADEMGLGKTTSTIIAALETGAKKILIICPASLKVNWEREIRNYTDRDIFICEGKKYSKDHDFVIMNYDIVKNFHSVEKNAESKILDTNFDLVIIDEAHFLSNAQALRTKLINSFAKKITRVWLLTGTPITSRPINYFNLLNLVESPVASNWVAYVIRYCQGYQFFAGKRKVWNTSGASNLEELKDRTSRQILRRLKESVLDLPEKIITPTYLRLSSKNYEELMGEYYDWYKKNPKESSSLTVQFNKLMKVRQVIAQEKVEYSIELAEAILAQNKKVIIFTNFTNVLQSFVSHFGKKCVYIDGSCNQNKRQKAVDDFQNNEKIEVFVGNLIAAGAGITLTAAEAVIMNDLSFVPAHHLQAEDRAHRYGQNFSVSVYYPIFENTIEGAVYDILLNKKYIFETVMGDNIDMGAEKVMEAINNQL